MNHNELSDKPDVDSILLPLVGLKVTQCRIDFALTLVLSSADEAYIRIESPFSLVLDNEEEELYTPGVSSLEPILLLLWKTIISAQATNAGNLKIGFQNKFYLVARPDPQYEAWEVSKSDGFRVVCMPGGELAIWLPEHSSNHC